jgi:hypothetical protein
MSNGVDQIAQDIVDQINMPIETVSDSNDNDINTENLEQFVINSASKLVKDSLDLIAGASGDALASGDPEAIEAAAALIKSSSSAVETLNRLLIANNRNKSAKEIKKLDIESKLQMNNEDNQTKLIMSREEVFKFIMDQDDTDDEDDGVIDIN